MDSCKTVLFTITFISMTLKSCFEPGMDSQLVVRPLLDKVEKNSQESALRKIAFPHVSAYSVCKK